MTASKSLGQAILNRRMLACALTGFSSGLPLYLLVQFVPAWLRSSDIDLATIGLFNLIMFPYTWKFLWAPIIDRYALPFLGARRGWMIVTQTALLLLMLLLSGQDPVSDMTCIIIIVSLIAFFSASQDVVVDAYRRELLPDEELGAGNGFFTQAYRIASFIPGSMGLVLVGFCSWQMAHVLIAGFMLVGIATTFWLEETATRFGRPTTITSAVVDPFKEFIFRDGWRKALVIMLFLFLYKFGDSMTTALETPFFLDMGFSTVEIGSIAKFTRTGGAAIGAIVGGIAMVRLGINRSLWIFGVFQMVSILGYAALAMVGHGYSMLAVATFLEYLGVGLGTVALLAYMARTTSKQFTATQFALFSSLAMLPRTIAGAASGFIVEAIGYTDFFILCFFCAIPGMLLLIKIAPWDGR
jgi:MFS transporter, PAT family, beta-lactamase induction signal transducer AmpG